MITTFLTLTLTFLVADSDSKKDSSREPHPFAPSLPLLTEEEEKRLDDIINRFILYDIGQLQGTEGIKALREFEKLGPEAIPALIRGLNRSAEINNSCPVLVIGKKLQRYLASTKDVKLLEFARDEIGAGVGRTKHHAVLSDLRLMCTFRKNALARQGITSTPKVGSNRSVRLMSTSELAKEADQERGQRLRDIVVELGQRPGDESMSALGAVAARTTDLQLQQAVRNVLVRNLSQVNAAALKEKLKDRQPEVRLGALRVVLGRNLPWGAELIDLLGDEDTTVQNLAHQALVRLNRGVDYGPSSFASTTEREQAIQKWRLWWSRQGGR